MAEYYLVQPIADPDLLNWLIRYVSNQTCLRRNFPFVGRGRWVMEFLRPFLRQYFFESETDGVPINRMFRSVIYQRAKGAQIQCLMALSLILKL